VKILCDKVFTNKTTKIIASFRLERFWRMSLTSKK
jgi:hypothetical protein